MAGATKAPIRTTVSMALESTRGLMAVHTKATGKMENNTAKAPTQQVKEKLPKLESGFRVNARSGFETFNDFFLSYTSK